MFLNGLFILIAGYFSQMYALAQLPSVEIYSCHFYVADTSKGTSRENLFEVRQQVVARDVSDARLLAVPEFRLKAPTGFYDFRSGSIVAIDTQNVALVDPAIDCVQVAE